MATKLSPAAIAALKCIRDHGNVESFYLDGGYGDYSVKRIGNQALWFPAADKVTDSLVKRGLCTNDGARLGGEWELTDAGTAALASAEDR
jgi:hypothetical protein